MTPSKDSLYATLIEKYAGDSKKLAMVEKAAERAIDFAAKYYEYAVDRTDVDDAGELSLTFHPGQQIDDEDQVVMDAQADFEKKFAELIEEYENEQSL